VTTTPSPSTPSGVPSGDITVRGAVEEGVEAGCMLLKADDGPLYLLVAGDRSMIAQGGRLEVVGRPVPDLMTTCQQGTPFKVSQTRRL
jgi:hypothetical protein